MRRRVALKNIGLSLGYMAATPTLISLAQSCKSKPLLDWNPEFFSEGQANVLTKLVDIIIPKTDTPSASEMGVPQFMDAYLSSAASPEDQNFMKMSMDVFTNKALKDSGKSDASDLTEEDLEPVLAAGLKVEDADKGVFYDSINSYKEAVSQGQTPVLDEGASVFAYANDLRGSVIHAYRISEYVGEEVLAYLPVPGMYVPCGDVNELSGGKAWSL